MLMIKEQSKHVSN